ncbi:unnamed protein product [Tetraodon nigroviridis]|uniref:(spotted green pufferfish) hypothetical protein n=1 Tax=Tetraodon nigroviridis TaxID=99883 RepID=Q4S0Z0_TETNG|nr:unnamed protein product [Tetraodon nigroviridis]
MKKSGWRMKTEDEFNKVNRQESQEVVGGGLRTRNHTLGLSCERKAMRKDNGRGRGDRSGERGEKQGRTLYQKRGEEVVQLNLAITGKQFHSSRLLERKRRGRGEERSSV